MKQLAICCLFVFLILAAFGSPQARKVPGTALADRDIMSSPEPADLSDLPPDIRAAARPTLTSAAADTFHLAWFSFGTAAPDWQGWTTIDETAQPGPYFHVASGLNELDGGTFGQLLPLEGAQSVWCGASPQAPFCGYATLPGYGNGWKQYWTFCYEHTEVIVTAWLHYLIFWDSEPGYDQTVVQVQDNAGVWQDQASVNGGVDSYDVFFNVWRRERISWRDDSADWRRSGAFRCASRI